MAIGTIVVNEAGSSVRAKMNAAIGKANLVDDKADLTRVQDAEDDIAALQSTKANLTRVQDAEADITEIEASRATYAEVVMAGSRPGEIGDFYTDTLDGTPNAVLPRSGKTTSTYGRVASIPGAGTVAPINAFRIEPGHIYRVRFVVRRATDSSDPAGDAIRLGLRWLADDYSGVSTVVLADLVNIIVASGRVEQSFDFPTTYFPIPEGGIYVRPFVTAYGADGVSHVEVIECVDITISVDKAEQVELETGIGLGLQPRYFTGDGFKIGDINGNYIFEASDSGMSGKLGDRIVNDNSLGDALLSDILAIRSARDIIRYLPGAGLKLGSPAGDFVLTIDDTGKIAFTPAADTLTSIQKTRTRDALASAADGVYRIKTVSAKSQIHRVTGSGETQISDGVANDTDVAIVGDSLRFVSDRDGAPREMRMLADGKSLVSARGSNKVYILVGYGQSLGIGTSVSPVAVTSVAAVLGSVLRFNRGVRIIAGVPAVTDVVADASIDRLVPLIGNVDGTGYGQTHLESMAYKLQALSGYRSVALAAGVGGQSYNSLKKGTVPYSNMIKAIQRAVTILASLGWDAEVIYTWQHGEADAGATRAVYKGYLAELVTNLTADTIAITGQTAVHVFAGQSPSLNASQVPIALWESSKEIANLHLVGPLYDLPFSDTQHPTSVGYHYLGEEYARAIWTVLAGSTWKPMQPISATLSGSNIDVIFEGQTGSVVSETTIVAAIGNMGLEYFDASSPPAISSVSLITNGVRITLASAPAGSGKVVRCAYTKPGALPSPTGGARSNIADQDTLISSYDSRALPKRAVLFEISVT